MTTLWDHYFCPSPLYSSLIFRRRFRVSRNIFERVYNACLTHPCFQYNPNAAGKYGIHPLVKITAVFRYYCPTPHPFVPWAPLPNFPTPLQTFRLWNGCRSAGWTLSNVRDISSRSATEFLWCERCFFFHIVENQYFYIFVTGSDTCIRTRILAADE